MAGKRTIGTQELAGILGISRQRINELGRKGKIERETDGKWDVAKVREALGRNLDGSQPSKVSEHPAAERELMETPEPKRGTLLYEQWRLTREKADRERLDREVLERNLLKSDEIRSAVCGMIAASKSRLITMPDELCDRLAAESDAIRCREMVAAKVHEALEQLSEWPVSA